jgi:hypothetical protein
MIGQAVVAAELAKKMMYSHVWSRSSRGMAMNDDGIML